MDFTDYYAETTATTSATTGSAAANVGRGLGARSIPTTTVASINPLKAMGAVMLAWGAVNGIINFRRYKKGKITKEQAITATASESAGMGIAAGLGLLADGIVKTYILATAAPAILPFVVGVAVTTGAKITWDCKTKKNLVWCERGEKKKDFSSIKAIATT
jgi:hypothetical protein